MGKKHTGTIHDSFGAASLANASTTYVEVPVADGSLGMHIRWEDATSAATITLESSNESVDRVAYNSVVAGDWFPESTVTITGPTAVAAGSSMTNLGNIGADRLRLKIVTTAISKLRVRANWKSA